MSEGFSRSKGEDTHGSLNRGVEVSLSGLGVLPHGLKGGDILRRNGSKVNSSEGS